MASIGAEDTTIWISGIDFLGRRMSLGSSPLPDCQRHQDHQRRLNEHETQSSCMGRFDRRIGRAC